MAADNRKSTSSPGDAMFQGHINDLARRMAEAIPQGSRPDAIVQAALNVIATARQHANGGAAFDQFIAQLLRAAAGAVEKGTVGTEPAPGGGTPPTEGSGGPQQFFH